MGNNIVYQIYQRLYDHYGPQNWWPANSTMEILVGAVLTQNTNWSNVAKAIDNLKARELLTFEALCAVPVEEIAVCIRPSGYYNLKAKRLSNLLQMITEKYGGELDAMLYDDTVTGRANLLSVKGIGPETADAILLYCGNHPLFVVDAYTHRVFSRHRLAPEECDYHELQEIIMSKLPSEPQLFNEYHALLVQVGKDYCKKGNPLCGQCPLMGVEE